MSDNQPADLLGCYGNDEVRTPHLDALARNGIRFDNAHCVNAMCSPCRASVLTGLMPSQHGIHNWLDDRLVDSWPAGWSAIGEFPTIPAALKSAGYATALIGKYHLGVPHRPQLGFDHWVTFPHGHTVSFYGNEVIDQDKRYTCEGHTVDFFTDKTIEYLESRAEAEDPFFAFIPFNGPYGHFPAIAGRAENAFAALYDEADMHSVPREGLNSKVLDRFALRVQENGVREQFKGPLLLPNDVTALRNYFSQISLVDHGVGQIMAALQRLGMDRDTIVIYTADHGFSLGHNGIWGHAAASFPASAHRPSYHIPLIMSGGPVAPTGGCSGLASQIDLFPTLLELAGAETSPGLPSSARSLAPALLGENQDWPEAVYLEQEETRAIRTGEWLFAARFDGAPSYPMEDELYHLPSDPGETANLAADPAYAATVAELKAKVTAFFGTYADPKYDLWNGGTGKSNVTCNRLWQDAWGADWHPEFSPV